VATTASRNTTGRAHFTINSIACRFVSLTPRGARSTTRTTDVRALPCRIRSIAVPAEAVETIIGASPAIVALREYLPKLARSSATVLITGATGSGKERVAEAIHALGPRAMRPFVAVNCAALPEGLIESELFGHERGAFTGAVANATGYMTRADGGTLFLDEVGEMAFPAQAKLLRALETRAVQPVGSSRAVAVDLRVIAATNQPLEARVAAGAFRQDLFYRLNVAQLRLPALRDRREDIPLLLRHAIERLNARDRRAVGEPDTELMQCLVAYDWPGNVRELNNLVEAVFVDPPNGPIELRHVPPPFRDMFAAYRATSDDERARLLDALERTKWNKLEAARQLNWSRMTLYRRLAKYQLDRSK
jgi:two-component system response regulator HydG